MRCDAPCDVCVYTGLINRVIASGDGLLDLRSSTSDDVDTVEASESDEEEACRSSEAACACGGVMAFVRVV